MDAIKAIIFICLTYADVISYDIVAKIHNIPNNGIINKSTSNIILSTLIKQIS